MCSNKTVSQTYYRVCHSAQSGKKKCLDAPTQAPILVLLPALVHCRIQIPQLGEGGQPSPPFPSPPSPNLPLSLSFASPSPPFP